MKGGHTLVVFSIMMGVGLVGLVAFITLVVIGD